MILVIGILDTESTSVNFCGPRVGADCVTETADCVSEVPGVLTHACYETAYNCHAAENSCVKGVTPADDSVDAFEGVISAPSVYGAL